MKAKRKRKNVTEINNVVSSIYCLGDFLPSCMSIGTVKEGSVEYFNAESFEMDGWNLTPKNFQPLTSFSLCFYYL
jgi:hypothetical protein